MSELLKYVRYVQTLSDKASQAQRLESVDPAGALQLCNELLDGPRFSQADALMVGGIFFRLGHLRDAETAYFRGSLEGGDEDLARHIEASRGYVMFERAQREEDPAESMELKKTAVRVLERVLGQGHGDKASLESAMTYIDACLDLGKIEKAFRIYDRFIEKDMGLIATYELEPKARFVRGKLIYSMVQDKFQTVRLLTD